MDAIGNGVSFRAIEQQETAADEIFPFLTIRDMVESEHRLLTEVLHISHLRAVMGISMGWHAKHSSGCLVS